MNIISPIQWARTYPDGALSQLATEFGIMPELTPILMPTSILYRLASRFDVSGLSCAFTCFPRGLRFCIRAMDTVDLEFGQFAWTEMERFGGGHRIGRYSAEGLFPFLVGTAAMCGVSVQPSGSWVGWIRGERAESWQRLTASMREPMEEAASEPENPRAQIVGFYDFEDLADDSKDLGRLKLATTRRTIVDVLRSEFGVGVELLGCL